jgi:hypothetical protein
LLLIVGKSVPVFPIRIGSATAADSKGLFFDNRD